MDVTTSVLFDLPGFVVVERVELEDGDRRVLIMQVAVEHRCPRCGVLVGGTPYDVRESRITDVPFAERALVVIWRKRRYRCLARSCRQKLSVERSSEIAPRRRSSERLRRVLARADGQCRAYSQVAASYQVSWWLVNDVAARTAGALPVEPPPVRWLGIGETSTLRPRRHHDPVTGSWWREEPWMTSLMNLHTASGRAILGLTPGRSSTSVCTRARAGLAGRDRGRGDRPLRGLCLRGAPGVAAADDRGRSVPPGPRRQRHAHQGRQTGRLGQPRPS